MDHGKASWVKYTKFRLSSLAPSLDSDADDAERSCSLSRTTAAVDSVDPDFESKLELLYLAHSGDADGIQSLIDQGVDVNFADMDSRTALHLAACEGNAEAVRLLLRKGANLEAQDRWGSTPLADALHYKKLDVCKILLEHGGKYSGKHVPSECIPNPYEVPVPEYEIKLEELDFSCNIQLTKKGYQVATWRGIQVFVKSLRKDFVYNDEDLAGFRSEFALIQKLRHPNIVQFLGAVTQTTPMMMIFEYLPKGDLYSYLKSKGPLNTWKAVEFALDIARGMNYLHEHKPDAIIHRDLKPKNILLDEYDHLKVTDFGLSKALMFTSQTVREQGAFSLKGSSCRYIAPEVFKQEAYGREVDIFAFGLILQEMIEGCHPFPDLDNKDVPSAYAEKNMRPPFQASSKCYPGDLRRLIEECWDRDPQKRPTFEQTIERLEGIKLKYSESSFWKKLMMWPHG